MQRILEKGIFRVRIQWPVKCPRILARVLGLLKINEPTVYSLAVGSELANFLSIVDSDNHHEYKVVFLLIFLNKTDLAVRQHLKSSVHVTDTDSSTCSSKFTIVPGHLGSHFHFIFET